MSPLDRITQLTEENRQLRRTVDELRSQVETARHELARQAGTIAKLAKDKRELADALEPAILRVAMEAGTGNRILSAWLPDARKALSHHANP